MREFDLLIRGGTIVDGTGRTRFVGDLGVVDGVVGAVGDISGDRGLHEIDATGRIVAPGVIDAHTHYDAQINWDPYCTISGWHGMTTAVLGNCGFGYAPCRPGNEIRYMQMMVNTEQIPYAAQAAGLSWEWSTFPEWLDHLKRLPKGVNVLTYLPMNPLMCYVMGVEGAKMRPATDGERRRMRELLHEAMDLGALGFSFSYLGIEGNSHVDFDQSPMPTDVMAEEEAFNLCEVLRERGEGMIQLLSEMPGTAHPEKRRAFVEELARRSGQRVIDNVVVPIVDHPEFHRGALRWLEDARARGLDIWMQSFTGRGWSEFKIEDMNAWDCVPVFRALTQAPGVAGKLALVRSADYRERLRREYDPARLYEALGPLEDHYILDEGAATRFAVHRGKRFAQLSAELGTTIPDLFLDILCESELQAELGIITMVAHDPTWKRELMDNPYVLAGSSDGGAHGKFGTVGYWPVDLIMQMVRETGLATLEEVHAYVSARTAKAFGLGDRGTLEVGRAADVMVYDLDALDYRFGKYEVRHDLPGDEWRRVVEAEGIDYILVNGQITFDHAACTGATPGHLIRKTAEVAELIAAQ